MSDHGVGVTEMIEAVDREVPLPVIEMIEAVDREVLLPVIEMLEAVDREVHVIETTGGVDHEVPRHVIGGVGSHLIVGEDR